jgi:predicted amidohydrolase YtcJ
MMQRVALAVLAVAAAACTSTPADLVVVNANVLTVDAAFAKAGGVAIRDGRFVHVAPDGEDLSPYIGPGTRVVDAGGRTVIPGIIDTHVHALMAAAAEASVPFRDLGSIAEIQAWVREEVSRQPAGTWIWTPRLFPTRVAERRFPTRAELDEVAPAHPVVVDGAYALMLNTAALRAAGIDRHTPNPPGGSIVKDGRGEPSGLLRNVGGMLAAFRPASAGAVPLEGLEAVHRAYLAHGITSVIERGADVEGLKRYQELKDAGRLAVRATITLQLPRPSSADEVDGLIDALPVEPGQRDDRLKVGALKIIADGGILAGTSYMRDPYGLDAASLYGVDDPAYRGFLTVPPDVIARVFKAGHDRGWQVSAHITGDAGVDTVLDAIEAAQGDAAQDRRHTLIHAYFPSPETAARAARLGVLVDTQPAWYYKDVDGLLPALGEARLQRFIGVRTWLDAGARTALNTDHMFGLDGTTAMNPFNPFLTMYVAITRRSEGGTVVGPDQAISREDALRLMTREAAYFSFDEASRGSIEVGKLGDLVVLSDDLLSVPDEKIRDIKADITVVGGEVVYERVTDDEGRQDVGSR